MLVCGLHELIIEAGPARVPPLVVDLLEVAFHGAVRVEVVFDDRQAYFARGGDRLFDLLDILVAFGAGLSIENIAGQVDHQIADGDAHGLPPFHHRV